MLSDSGVSFSHQDKNIYRDYLYSIGKKHGKEMTMWSTSGVDAGCELVLKANYKIIHRETKDSFSLDDYIGFLEFADNLLESYGK